MCFCNDGVSHMEQLTGAVEERRVWLHLWVCGEFYILLNLLFNTAVT